MSEELSPEAVAHFRGQVETLCRSVPDEFILPFIAVVLELYSEQGVKRGVPVDAIHAILLVKVAGQEHARELLDSAVKQVALVNAILEQRKAGSS